MQSMAEALNSLVHSARSYFMGLQMKALMVSQLALQVLFGVLLV